MNSKEINSGKGRNEFFADTDYLYREDFAKMGNGVMLDIDFSRAIGFKTKELRKYKSSVKDVLEQVASKKFNVSDEKILRKLVSEAYTEIDGCDLKHSSISLSTIVSNVWNVNLTDKEAYIINDLDAELLIIHAIEQFLRKKVDFIFESKSGKLYFFTLAKKIMHSLGRNNWTYEDVMDIIAIFYEIAVRVINRYIFKEPGSEDYGSDNILPYLGSYWINVRTIKWYEEYGISLYLCRHYNGIKNCTNKYSYLHNGKKPTIKEILEVTGLSLDQYFNVVNVVCFTSHNEIDENKVGNNNTVFEDSQFIANELKRLLKKILDDERAYYIVCHSKNAGLYEYLGEKSESNTELAERYNISVSRTSEIKTAALKKIAASTYAEEIRNLLKD